MVGIAAGLLAIIYSEYWNRVFRELDLEIDSVFASSLLTCDKKKNKKRKK